jgi:hypothetical protein
MIDKVMVRSYSAKSSKQVKRKCPLHKRLERAELVDWGKGGRALYFECGIAKDPDTGAVWKNGY